MITRFANLSYKRQQTVITILFLLVPLGLLLVFGYLPVLAMAGYSFFKWDGLTDMQFTGFDNYADVFTRPELFKVFGVSLYYFTGSFIQIAIALFFATILSFRIRGRNFFKGVLFFPSLINGVAIAFIFLYFFRDTGTLNTFLRMIGLGNMTQLWLTNPKIINFALAGVSVWRYLGFNMVMFLGAIQSISNEIFEASELDGATRWHQFRYIIFPSIKPIVTLNLILSLRGALSVFEIPYVMTGGTNGSSTFVIKTIETAFTYSKVGLASAMAMVLTIIILLVTVIQQQVMKDREKKYAGR